MKQNNLLKSSMMVLLMFFAVMTWGQQNIPAGVDGAVTVNLNGWNGNLPSGLTHSGNQSAYRGTSENTQGGTYAIVNQGYGTRGSSNNNGLTMVATFRNNTGAVITSLDISYNAFVISANPRTPGWSVTSSLSGVGTSLNWVSTNGAQLKTVTLTNLNLANNATFTLTFSSDRGGGSGASPMIGLNNIKVVNKTVNQSPCTTPSGSITEEFIDVNVGQPATFTVESPANYTSIQWQVDQGNGWTNIQGATGVSYTTAATTTDMTGYMYRAVMTNASAGCTPVSENTNEAMLIVNDVIIAPALVNGNFQGTVGISASFQIINNGSAAVYEVSTGELPAGLTLDANSGLISGTPTAAGDYFAQISAENTAGTSTADFDFSISQGTQTVTGLTDLSKNINEGSFTLPEFTNAGLTISYSSSNSSVASASGNIVTLNGAGTTVITAAQAGNSNWNSFSQNFTLTVIEGPCGLETFENMTPVASSYATREWIGDNGTEWRATDARTDQTIDGKAVTLRIGELSNTTTITGGIGSLTFEYARVFAGNSTLQVFVNDVQYGDDITVSSTDASTYSVEVNVSEDATIRLVNSGQRTAIDNVSWTCYAAPEEAIIWENGAWTATPTATDDVIIRDVLFVGSDYPSFEVNNLTVQSGTGAIYIEAGSSITVNGIIDNENNASEFIVEDGASLIQTVDVLNYGEITVLKNSTPMKRSDNTLWSSPVESQSIRNFSAGTLWNRFWTYNESTDLYAQLFTSTSDDASFTAGQGVAIRIEYDPNFGADETRIFEGEFTGTPFNGTKTVTLTNSLNGYNIVGNPYASNVRIGGEDSFFSANTNVNALYFWTHDGAGTYATVTRIGSTNDASSSQNISVGQGFIVGAPTGGVVTFNNAMRVDGTAPFYKGATEEINRIWLSLSDSQAKFNQILVGYLNSATNGVDAQIDGTLLTNGISSIYSLIDSEMFAVQGRAPFEDTDVVALGLKAENAGLFSIALENMDGLFSEGQIVYLKDNELSIIHNLTEGAYSFESAAGVFNERFEIVYESDDTMGNNELTSNSVQVYMQNNNIVVNSKSEKILSVELYDMNGRNIHRNQKVNANLYQISSASKGVLVVRVLTQNGQIVTKKIINK